MLVYYKHSKDVNSVQPHNRMLTWDSPGRLFLRGWEDKVYPEADGAEALGFLNRRTPSRSAPWRALAMWLYDHTFSQNLQKQDMVASIFRITIYVHFEFCLFHTTSSSGLMTGGQILETQLSISGCRAFSISARLSFWAGWYFAVDLSCTLKDVCSSSVFTP